MLQRPPSPGLLGRRAERGELDQLLATVRRGESQVLVLRGDAGVGKTVLLEYAAANAAAFRVVRAAGVEAEMELPFAGLHALCAPLLGRLGGLPAPQREALGTAFGLATGPPPDRFLVGLAVLSLLADAAEERPLLCLVDDAQWLDRVSAQLLAFVARRVLAERVGLVVARRETADDDPFSGFPELVVTGLEAAAARRLLDATIPGPLDERVRARILAEAGGNPLALLELPRGVSAAGGFGVPSLTSRIEQGFARRLASLPDDTRGLLLVAAADPVGDVLLLRRAGELLGIAPEAQEPAQHAGLIEIGASVRFRHPLVRSAAYRAASAGQRRAAHDALARATNPELDPDRRAWHRAHAAHGPDEAVAGELERSAGRAQARGGVAAAAAFLDRATLLTPDPALRGRRALAAAQAMFEAAAPERARELLAVAEDAPLQPLQRARVDRLRAQIAFALRRGNDAPPLLFAAARGLETLDPALARQTYLEAVGAAIYAGRLSTSPDVRTVATAIRAAPPAAGAPRALDLLLDGMAVRFTEGPAAGAPRLRIAVEAFRDEALDGHEQTMRWLLLAPVIGSMNVFELWDDDAFHAVAERAVRLARDAGALNMLAVGLVYLSGVRLFAGEFELAEGMIQEADAISAATGNAGLVYGALVLAAWRGVESSARRTIEDAVTSARARGEGRVLALAGYAGAVLDNGLGRHEAAIDSARRGCEDDTQGYAAFSLAELIEAQVAGGRPDGAAEALDRLEQRARAAGTDWALGVYARSRALVTGDEASYREAIERLSRTRIRVESARAHLVYGEWLRRAGRRAAAREPLRAAYERFHGMGAQAFAERARGELEATGEPVRRLAATRDPLTPQETQIARLAAEGHTNPEIGAQLFLSPRTVEYHLRKVFDKLAVSSRRELAGALP